MIADAVRFPFVMLALALSAVACATLQKNQSVCPEFRDIHCATSPECSMDPARGCEVCQCRPAGADAEGNLPSGAPPDRR
jgi:hypothetical protein